MTSCVAPGSWELGHSSLVVSELWNSGCEPHAALVTNQEDGAGAVGRHRTQTVVDSKIAVWFERNTDGRVVLANGAAASQINVAKTL